MTGVVILFVATIMGSDAAEAIDARISTIQILEQGAVRVSDASMRGRIAFNMAYPSADGGRFESFQQYTYWLFLPDPTNVHDSMTSTSIGRHGFISFALFFLLIASRGLARRRSSGSRSGMQA